MNGKKILTIVALLAAACALAIFIGERSSAPKLGEPFTGEVNTYPGVTMTLVGEAMPGCVTVEVLNTTDAEIDSGNEYDFAVQQEVDGVWYSLEYEPMANPAEALIYSIDEPRQLTFSWARRHGSLPEGKYRVVKGFFEYRGPGDYTDFLLAAEFTLD